MGLFYVSTPPPKPDPRVAKKREPRADGAKRAPSERRANVKVPVRYVEGQCSACTLNHENLASPKMKPTGAAHPIVYMLGEAPGREEDERGEQFVGESGRFIRGAIPERWKSKIRWNNTVRCRPPKNRDPTYHETACCRRFQEQDIEQAKPEVIVAIGRISANWLLGIDSINAWRGRWVPVTVGSHSCWAFIVHHPSYILRQKHEPKWEQAFMWDMKQLFAKLDNGLSEPTIESPASYHDGITSIITDLDEIEAALDAVAKEPQSTIDLETNCLRPYVKDAKILTAAVGTYAATYSFPLHHSQAKWTPKQLDHLLKRFERFLLNSGTKFAHSLMFEMEMLSFFFGAKVLFETQWGDTMAQAYCLDARSGALGLEDLTRLYFGFNVKALSDINTSRLDAEPLEKVLKYNGLDTKYTDLTRWHQEQLLDEQGLSDLYYFHIQRYPALVMAQRKGLVPNQEAVLKHKKKQEEHIAKLLQEVKELPDIKSFQKTLPKEFNPESSVMLAQLLDQHLKLPQGRQRNGKYSTEEEVLEQIDHPIAELVLDIRGTRKLLSTYVKPFMTGGKHVYEDGLVHCNYKPCRTITGRLSSTEPNSQNFPKREAKEIRTIICAPPKHWMAAFDYGQIEARVIAMASQCPVLAKEMSEGSDIHYDWTIKVAKALGKPLRNKKAVKTFRNDIKNGWTFPAFYGSILDSIAIGFGADPIEVKNGTSRILRSLKPLFDEFWDKYRVVKTWQQELLARTAEVGYVESLVGRRRPLPVSDNEGINTPTQGTASDIVVAAMTRLSRISYEEEQPQYQAVLNVHDDLTFYLPDKTLETDIERIGKEMARADVFPWISVPLTVEVSVGRNWGEQEEVEVFKSC